MSEPFQPTNDNNHLMFRYSGSDSQGARLRLLKHVLVARRLIKRYVDQPWKYSNTNSEYGFVEWQLCTLLDYDCGTVTGRKMMIRHLAIILGVSALKLFNDPILSFQA